MPRAFIKKYTPTAQTVKSNKNLQFLSQWLHDGNLWHMNRRSVAGAVACGLFWAMIPVPLQMITAAITAIFFRVNLPISVALVWLTNPITIPPIFYCAYLVGAAILNSPPLPHSFEWSVDFIMNSLHIIWMPLFAGSLVLATTLSLLGYVGVRGLWRLSIVRRWQSRSHH